MLTEKNGKSSFCRQPLNYPNEISGSRHHVDLDFDNKTICFKFSFNIKFYQDLL